MTPDIERLAKEAGIVLDYYYVAKDLDVLAKFAHLLAEECAKECEAQLADGECPERAQYCADAIRAKFALSNEAPEAK